MNNEENNAKYCDRCCKNINYREWLINCGLCNQCAESLLYNGGEE